MEQTRVVLGLDEPALQDEVLHFLERTPRLTVVRAVGDGGALSRAVAEASPDATVVSPAVLAAAPELDGATLLVVAERETTAALRVALRTGARGFYLWPEEREGLARDASAAAGRPAAPATEPGRILAVLGARGGAGATFLATNLAAAVAGEGTETALADLDLVYADASGALGVAPGSEPGTIADLVPVAAEISGEHLDRVLYEHPRGFRALLAPPEPGSGAVGPAEATAVLRALAQHFAAVVAHVPRGLDPAALAALDAADAILLVVTLDVLAFRDATRVLGLLAARGLDGRCRLVVNRAVRSEVVPEDCERVFGLRPIAVLPADRSVPRAQNRGELVAGRSSRIARRLTALARVLLEEER